MTYDPANEQQWMARRNCTQSEAEAFFVVVPRGALGKWDGDAEAKRLCAGCDVKDECLEFSQKIGATEGVWGGLNERERAALVTDGAA